MMPDFPHNIRIRLAQLFFLLHPDVALDNVGYLSLIRPILFLYYEESLVSSNLNSKLFRFHLSDLTYISINFQIEVNNFQRVSFVYHFIKEF
jgi:hypothetical protein